MIPPRSLAEIFAEICATDPTRHVVDSPSTCHAQLGDILLGADEMACHVADEERALEEARDAVIALQMVQARCRVVCSCRRRLLLLPA